MLSVERKRTCIDTYANHFGCKDTNSSPLTHKISVTNYISIISKNAWRFLVDSNVQFYIPQNAIRAFLIVERIGINGIMSILRNAILSYFSDVDCEDFVLNVNPLTLNKLVDKKMLQMSGEAKKVILRQVRKDDLRVSKIFGQQLENSGITTDIVYNAAINKVFSFGGFLERIKTRYNPKTKLYEVDKDMSCGDIAFNVKIGGQDKVFSLMNIQTLGMSVDITSKVVLGQNSYPTYRSVHNEADEVLSYIREQFNILDHE